MSTPAIIWIVLALIGLALNAALDGQPRTGKHSFALAFVRTATIALLLLWGGFFS